MLAEAGKVRINGRMKTGRMLHAAQAGGAQLAAAVVRGVVVLQQLLQLHPLLNLLPQDLEHGGRGGGAGAHVAAGQGAWSPLPRLRVQQRVLEGRGRGPVAGPRGVHPAAVRAQQLLK